MNIILDLETIGATDPAIIERIGANIKPPGNMKKAETIAAWAENDKPAAVEEALLKTAFDGTYGKIVCIGFAIDDKPAVAISGDDEKHIINRFYQSVQDAMMEPYCGPLCMIGHNLIGFDLKFLWKRSVILGIKPPKSIPFKAKPWDAVVFDSMQEWDKDSRVSLDNLCAALKIPTPKGEMDGSKVWDAYKAGKFEEIGNYCMGDVNATREVYRRMTFA